MATKQQDNTLTDTIAGQCIAVRMRMLNRVVTKVYDDALRPLGLRVSQLNILVATARMGIARPAQVCDILHLEISTLSRNVERMRAKGWLTVVSDQDGRAQPFRLTPKGHRLLDKAAPVWGKAQQQAQSLLGGDFVKCLNQSVASLNGSAPGV